MGQRSSTNESLQCSILVEKHRMYALVQQCTGFITFRVNVGAHHHNFKAWPQRFNSCGWQIEWPLLSCVLKKFSFSFSGKQRSASASSGVLPFWPLSCVQVLCKVLFHEFFVNLLSCFLLPFGFCFPLSFRYHSLRWLSLSKKKCQSKLSAHSLNLLLQISHMGDRLTRPNPKLFFLAYQSRRCILRCYVLGVCFAYLISECHEFSTLVQHVIYD